MILRAAGANVILTQNGRTAYGPCVNIRAAIGNRAHADAAVAIHADGGPPGGYGFAILVPELVQNASTDTSPIIEPSHRLAGAMVRHFASVTGQNLSTYLGASGIMPRNDLAGLNLSTVPKVFIECANMRNAQDAVKVTSPTGGSSPPRASPTRSTHSSRPGNCPDRMQAPAGAALRESPSCLIPGAAARCLTLGQAP